jgi:rRNA maturation endonuclease Nob1
MGLFKRQKSAGTACPRCSQLVTEANADVCPMCGWDVREAYQGSASSPLSQAAATSDSSGAGTAH